MNDSDNIHIKNLVNSIKLMSGFGKDMAIGIKNLNSEHVYLSEYCRYLFKVEKDVSGLVSIWLAKLPYYFLVKFIVLFN